ncbi:transposase [Pseudomonas vanderleydeniana]|uniref:Transposase n=1 Tax=Pseudomonas vanderleydeniana TaxID=2745495 RepID=A0A9E6PH39_9PSED|nr:transposase [Pseudomonas vanderleydeniana]QXI26373.1 transposase [Pseudomonas vanderleydeniana]
MNTAFDLEVHTHGPQAEMVYDLFHGVAKSGRQVIDRVRVNDANRLRGDRSARKVVKSSRWLLLRNRENVTREVYKIRLEKVLEANQALMTVYVLKDTPQGTVGLPSSGLRLALLARLVRAGDEQRDHAAQPIRPTTEALPSGHPGTHSLALGY